MMRTGRGFTLLELLIVLMVVGILLATGLTAYRKAQQRAQVNEAIGLLAATLRDARSLAQRYNVSLRVRFPNGRTYKLEPASPTPLSIRTYERRLPNYLTLSYSRNGSTWNNPTGLAVQYSAPFGETSAVPLVFRVTHRNAPDFSACLRIIGVTGKVVIARACP